jgi:hypothetical protein
VEEGRLYCWKMVPNLFALLFLASSSQCLISRQAEAFSFFASRTPHHVVALGSYLDDLGGGSSRVGGAGITSYLDSVGAAVPAASAPPAVPVANVPVPISTVVAEPIISALAANPNAKVTPTTTVDTKVSQDGLQTTLTITSVTTVVIDDSP